MVRRLVVGMLVVLLVVGLGGPGLGSAASDGDRPGPQPPQTTPEGYDSTVFEIEIFENGSARWSIRHSQVLQNESEVDQFQSFADRFERGNTSTFSDFQTRAERLVAAGENVTNRDMAARNFARAAYVDDSLSFSGEGRGVVELSFTWGSFARMEEGRVVVGDIFEGGMYIGEGQSLRFRTGSGLQFVPESVAPSPDSMARPGNLSASDTVTWEGERQFNDNRPYAALSATGSGSVTETAATTPTSDNLGQLLVVGVLVLLGLGGGLAWYTGYLPPGDRSGFDDDGAVAAAGSTDATAGAQAAGTTTEQVSEPQIVSDEDQVLNLLEENGGRMKQVNIVDQTDWSKSKVSMLLSDMEDEGDISKLRVGRENIISLAGQEPAAAGSPFEEE
ncbi:helix-turn-helix transcriptional regulator [Halobacteriales archaeon Cl-PHB]